MGLVGILINACALRDAGLCVLVVGGGVLEGRCRMLCDVAIYCMIDDWLDWYRWLISLTDIIDDRLTIGLTFDFIHF